MAFFGFCGPACVQYILKQTVKTLRRELGLGRGKKLSKSKIKELTKNNKLNRLLFVLPSLTELGDILKTSSKLGTDNADIVRYLKKVGFKTKERSECDWNGLKEAVENREFVLVDWWTDIGDPGQDLGHYCVAVAVGKKFLTLFDPDINKKRRLGKDKFLSRWHDIKPDGSQLNQWLLEIWR